jgi:hypothetical protein
VEGYLRFCYANSLERIDEALARIGAFLHQAGPADEDPGRQPKAAKGEAIEGGQRAEEAEPPGGRPRR